MTIKKFKEARPARITYQWQRMYSVREMCQMLQVHEEDFFEKSFRKEILMFNSGIKLKV